GFDSRHSFFSRGESLLMAVRYVDRLDFFPHVEDLSIESLAFTKSSTWAYEREWRFVKALWSTKGPDRTLSKTPRGYDLWLERVPAPAFLSVTYGARAKKKLRVQILKALSKHRFRHVKLYEARMGANGRLSFRRLDRSKLQTKFKV